MSLGATYPRCEHCGALMGRLALPLTPKQYALYSYLVAYTTLHGFAPSFDEIAGHFGYRSLATVHEHLQTLERKSWIRRRYNESRAIECLVAA